MRLEIPVSITSEEIVKLENQILQKKLFEQYLKKLIEILDVNIEVYLTAAEVSDSWFNEMPLELFRLCTAPPEARHEAAMLVLAHSNL
jgi:hypothetical protein